MSFINAWGIPIIAFAVVLVVLSWPLRRLPQEERKPYGILLGMISAVYVALCVSVAVAPNENLWIIESNALLSFVTLYLIHLAHAGEGRWKKLLLCGVFLSMILLLAACSDRVIIIILEQLSFDVTNMKEVQETAVTVFSAILMAHVVGLLELCLFGKKRRVVQLERYTVEHQSKKETIHYEE